MIISSHFLSPIVQPTPKTRNPMTLKRFIVFQNNDSISIETQHIQRGSLQISIIHFAIQRELVRATNMKNKDIGDEERSA
eukprot:gnl/Chilomastix_caulleri/3321.p2 GENE.gnl/Chilomastix_caulleri/3321~~gnl/Chilomastix_caulleri/3321.p2  ORF type:complete len:80 (-),score=20.93 gnl/Chilomastix_caulleri/3321:48-287(-)